MATDLSKYVAEAERAWEAGFAIVAGRLNRFLDAKVVKKWNEATPHIKAAKPQPDHLLSTWHKRCRRALELAGADFPDDCDLSKLASWPTYQGCPVSTKSELDSLEANVLNVIDEHGAAFWRKDLVVPVNNLVAERRQWFKGLAKRIQATQKTSGESDKPKWTNANGKLHFRGRIVKQIRNRATALSIMPILDKFEAQGWPDRIDDPLPRSTNPLRIHEVIRSLNNNLKHIVFRADGTSGGILWSKRSR